MTTKKYKSKSKKNMATKKYKKRKSMSKNMNMSKSKSMSKSMRGGFTAGAGRYRGQPRMPRGMPITQQIPNQGEYIQVTTNVSSKQPISSFKKPSGSFKQPSNSFSRFKPQF